MFHPVLKEMAALGVQHRGSLRRFILNPFQDRRIVGRGSVVISDQRNPAVRVGTDHRDLFYSIRIQRQYSVVFQ